MNELMNEGMNGRTNERTNEYMMKKELADFINYCPRSGHVNLMLCHI